MVLSLIFGKKYAQSSVNFANDGPAIVSFDTMVEENHQFTSRATYFPVESGTIVSDHIINEPDIITLSGLISDTPLNLFFPSNRSVTAFNQLIRIHEQRQVVDIVTGIKVYRNMALTSMNVPRTMKTGQTLTFNLQFQKIVFDDTIQVFKDNENVFSGIQDVTPRSIVAENTNIPFIQNDPQFSLKDQASTATNVGVQSLLTIPNAILPNILSNLPVIAGVI